MIFTVLFPRSTSSASMSWLLLFLRLVFGILFMLHGIEKLENFSTLSHSFPSIMGMSGRVSLILAIFAELVCGVAVVIGLFFRLALIPMIATMAVAFGLVHQGSVAQGELALIYLLVFLLLLATGPGRYAVDTPIGAYFAGREDKSDSV